MNIRATIHACAGRPVWRVTGAILVLSSLLLSACQPKTGSTTSTATDLGPTFGPPAAPARQALGPDDGRHQRGFLSGPPPGAQKAKVAKNVDGDTIWAEPLEPGPLAENAVHKIRILEVDTPESTRRVDCFGPDASQFAKHEMPVGSTVYLLKDRQDKDRYGRFLRYVWESNGEFYEEKVVREGFARVVLYRPNDAYISRLRPVEAEAKSTGQGLWRACPGLFRKP